ncbi:MAG: thiol oxidoreductase [Deltaproteobacteria bacterium HGW-Deltaproteobacteria-14]|jgi:CxxC motif-containing protein (DUF1111 family)|nr:MAG: thiol oxidoreductase [Deltaproteobacteria bacterium HGW-Deltaproteobacteria-14]
MTRPSALPLALLLALTLAGAGCDDLEAELAPVTAAERLPAGAGTNTLLLGSNAFTPPLEGLTAEEELAFYSGNSFFSQAWVAAPASTDARDGLGPLFNARSCGACHAFDGRGRPPLEADEPLLGLLLRLSLPGAADDEAPLPDPVYGGQLQPFALPGVAPEATVRVERDVVTGSYDDGTPYTLERPRYLLEAPGYGALPDDLEVSPRVAPQVIGMGLLEAIPEAAIVARADADDADGDGISGRVQRVRDPRTGALALGRFGWKGDAPSLEAQSAGAFHGDMGLTTSLAPGPECTDPQTDCAASPSGGDPEVSDAILGRVVTYLQLLAVPVRTRWNDVEVRRGKRLFTRLGCASCHVPEARTADDAASPALSGQRIFPYTDLLLHDMGPDLADGRPVFRASGQEWKTPPLWGIGRIPAVNKHDRLLHDGRARGVAEAILWHGGEAEGARDAFKALSADERAALIAFVGSL